MRIRAALRADAGALADIYLTARAAALPQVNWAHGPGAVHDWFAQTLLEHSEVWVADDGAPCGFVAFQPGWVDQLYLHPRVWRHGTGRLLLDRAKQHNPDGLRLWCFQSNAPARAFYAAQGFVATQFGDGADNEEREPDILFAWQGWGGPSGPARQDPA